MQASPTVRTKRSKLDANGQDLVLRYLPLARSLARPHKQHWPNVRDDFDSAACLALVEAAESYDPDRNIKFATFARYRIVGALRDLQRNLLAHRGQKAARSLASVALYTPTAPADHGRGLVLGMEQDPPVGLSVEHEDILECWLQKLPTKHAEACRLLFLAGKTQVEAARILGFSQSRLSSLRREALSMLKDASSSNSDDAA